MKIIYFSLQNLTMKAAVIRGGASGLVTLKYLLTSTREFPSRPSKLVYSKAKILLERHSSIGHGKG
jgi:hypothetical protein